jgi:hypothetical protein
LVEELVAIPVGAGADRLGGIEVEAAHEDGQAPEQDSFGFGQQCVRPVFRRAQCLVAAHRGSCAAGEQPETVVEAVDNLR